MSKIGIISDVHGNYPALCSVMHELEEKKCNKIICLGDISGYYSMINECVEMLIQKNVFCIKGNHDSYLLGEGICPRSKSVGRCIDYQKNVLKEEYYQWFKSLGLFYEDDDCYAVHGGFDDPLDEYVNDFDYEKAQMLMPTKKIFLSGHSHKQKKESNGIITYCNPGSVGQPRDYDSRAAYAILSKGELTLYRVEYDIDATARAMDAAGFNDYFYKNLYKGCKIGE